MERSKRRLIRGLAITLGGVMLGMAVLSPASAQQAPAFNITVTATVLDADAPIDVEATAVAAVTGGYAHGVVVTWNGAADAVLGDERFTHHVSALGGDGDLVTAGRGCGADWAEAEQEVVHICTLDFQTVAVSPGDSHEYPLNIHPVVGPLTLEAGTYTLDQAITWWAPGAEENQEQATVRLTYQVQEAGTVSAFVPEPAASGVTMAAWTGGPVSQLPEAASFWVTANGRFIPYVPGNPEFANAGFTALFPNEIPAGTIMLVVR